MNSDKFTNLLVATLVVLQLVSVLIVIFSWIRFGSKSLVVSCPLVFGISLLGVRMIMKIKVDGKSGKELNDMVGDVLAATIWTGIGSVLSIIAGLLLIHHHKPFKGGNIGYVLPFVAVGLFYGALALQAKVLK